MTAKNLTQSRPLKLKKSLRPRRSLARNAFQAIPLENAGVKKDCHNTSPMEIKLVRKTIGGSMRPAIKNNQPVWVEFLAFDRFRRGDMVLYKKEGFDYIHRILSTEPAHLIVSSDSCVTDPHPVFPDEIIGRPISLLNGFVGMVWGSFFRFLFGLKSKIYE